LVALAAITALGVFVRVHGLAGESVWFDEFTSLVFLKPPPEYAESPFYGRWQQYVFHQESQGLRDFLEQNRSIDPATMPVYDAMEYLWNGRVASSVAGMRLLSILIGALMFPLIYLLGRDLFGRTAGLVAVLCLALSPIHRHFAQEIHMYGLVSLLALCSAYTFLHVVRGGRLRWWLVHVAANTALVWTHSFGALVPMVEGGFFIVFFFRQYRKIAVWAAIHVVMAVPLAWFFTTIEFWSAEDTKDWMKVPTKHEFVGDLLADDCTGHTYQMRGTPQALERVVSPERAEDLVSDQHFWGRWLKRLFLGCAVWLALVSAWAGLRSWRGGRGASSWPWAFFLLAWWLLPALFLYTVSVYWRPVIFPRYTTHCSLGLYLILGGAIAGFGLRPAGVLRVAWAGVRAAAFCALAVLYAYQALLVLDGPQRTDWRSAGDFIRAEARPDDLILVQDWMWKRVFAYNLGPIENVVSYAKSREVLAEACAFFLDLAIPSKHADGEPCTVWVAIRTDYFGSGPDVAFEGEAGKRGLRFELAEFGGIQHVLVYHVWREGAAPAWETPALHEDAPKEFGDLSMEYWRVQEYDTAIRFAEKTNAIAPEYSRAYTYLGMALKEQGKRDAAIEAFEKAMAVNPFDYLWSHVNLCTLYMERGDYNLALASVERALAMDPNYAWGFTCKGKALVGLGDLDAAIVAFEKAVALDPNDRRGHDGLSDAKLRKENPGAAATPPGEGDPPGGAAARAREHMAHKDYDAALAAYREALRGDPQNGHLYADLAVALIGKGDDSGALVSMRKAFELAPDLGRQLGPLVKAVFETRDPAAVRGELERLREEGVEVPAELAERAEGELGSPDS